MTLEERLAALGDIGILIDVYFSDKLELIDGANDSWNPAAFWTANIENPSCGFWRFDNISKPTLEELEAIKASL